MAHEMRSPDWSAQAQRLNPVLTAPALLVGGMHRSGTSALTRVLSLAGADLPRTLMAPGQDNPLGFWESIPIQQVNDEVLAEAGSRWDDVFGFDTRPEAASLRQGAVARIRQAVQAEFDAIAMPVIKDPRISLLLPLWDLALREAGHSPYAIALVRHPMEVAQSLMRRNGFPVSKSLLLWLAYFVAFERDSRGMPRVFVTYDDLLTDWRGVVERIEKKLGLYLPKRSPAGDLEIERFLTSEARHHRADDATLERKDISTPWIRQAYDWARRAARGDQEPDVAELDAVRESMGSAARTFAPVVVDLTLKLDTASRDAADAKMLREKAGRLETELSTERETATAEIMRLEAEREVERERARAEIGRLEAERDAERVAATAEIRRIELERDAERVTATAEFRRLGDELLHAESQRVASAARADEQAAKAAALLAQVAQVRAQAGQLEEALAQSRRATLTMQAQRDEETHRADGYNSQIGALKAFIQSNMKTRSKLLRKLWSQSWSRPISDAGAMIAIAARRGPKKAAQTMHMTRAIRKAHVFDAGYYLQRYWDVAAMGRDPVIHYVTTGAAECRDPAPNFSTEGYLERHPDVAREKIPALFHFVEHGKDEGRQPAKPVDPALFNEPAAADAPAVRRTPPAPPVRRGANPGDPYSVRPDDSVAVEGAAGEVFCNSHQLMGATPDFAAAAEEINRLFSANPAPVGAPDVSIVIPVYGQLPYTLNALQALARQRSRFSFEIIVVDDKSPDQSAHWLASIPRVKLLRQAANGGFIVSCNAGAKLAQGRFLVMLNNDTRVVSGWLDELIGSFDVLPNAGLVGSKLFYPDGELQEAGGIIWRDGSAWNLGRNDDPGKPAYCYARQVDYVSGASIAVPAELWRQAGGFDEHYKPAYGEDSDLALKLRYQFNRGVWMQPLSRVIHYEGKTSGTDVATGVKAHQVANAKKLYARWSGDLSRHRPNADSPHLERDRGVTKRALVLDATTPEPDKDAGSLTCFELMRALQANGYKVSFLAESNLLYLPQASGALQRIGVEVGYSPYVASVEDYLAAHGKDLDVVMLFRNGVAARQMRDVRRLCPNARVIFHSSDLHFLREEREAELAADPKLFARAKETRKTELAIIRSADATIVHSSFEEEMLREAAPSANVSVFPWILDAKGAKAGFGQRRDVAFLGGYRHPPNADAVRYFVEKIWPLVRAKAPDMRFIIAGSEMPDDLAAMNGKDNVVAQGYVADLDQFFETIRLTVAPIRYGAGIKGKVAMSFAYGVPAVLTSCAAEGMGLAEDEIALVRDDPQAFADALAALYRDEARWTVMSRKALAFVDATYGSAMGHRKLAEIIAGAARNGAVNASR